MEYSQFYEEYGQPFSGRKLKRLQAFLESMQLSYDQGVEYTVNLVDAQGEIAATGSLQQNVIKCVAVDDRHQGEGLSSRVVTLLMNHAIEQGNSHLFVFTKPKNIAMFSDLGFFPIIQTEDVLFMENVRDGIGRYVRSLQHPKDNGGVIGAAVIGIWWKRQLPSVSCCTCLSCRRTEVPFRRRCAMSWSSRGCRTSATWCCTIPPIT